MDEKINTSLDFFEQAWGAALIKSNSTFFRQTGEIGGAENVTTLYDYVQKHPNSFTGRISSDQRFDDKLRKYYVMQDAGDKTGRGDDGKVSILTDNKGQDIALIYIRDSEVVVEVSPSILKNNEKMLKMASIADNGSTIEIADVEELSKLMEPDSLDKIVEQIEKYDSVKMRGRDDARNRIKDEDSDVKERAGVVGDLNDGKEPPEEEKEGEGLTDEEIEENASQIDIPSSEFDMIVELCKEEGLDPANIKQVAEVKQPKDLIEDIDNDRTSVDPSGGSVTVLRFKNADISSGTDKIFMIQDNKMLPQDSGNDEKVSLILDENKGNNVQIYNFDDPREAEVLAEIVSLKQEYDEHLNSLDELPGDPDSKLEVIDQLEATYMGKLDTLLDGYTPDITGKDNIKEQAETEMESSSDIKEDEVVNDTPEEEEEVDPHIPTIPEEHEHRPPTLFNNLL